MFTRAFFDFLRELRDHNDRNWFAANKDRYDKNVRDPALRFIGEFGNPLAKISKHLVADPRPVGGSMFRIYRDTRFASDKTPYKTAVGIRFPHRAARDVHSAGFYLHLEPGEIFVGAGIWHPETKTATMIREGTVERP